MSKNLFPRVLIIGQSFNSYTGGGITLSNLFSGWPHNNIAVGTYSIDAEGLDYCKNYYKFGYLENKRTWPFNLWQNKEKSGPIEIEKYTFKNGNQKYIYNFNGNLKLSWYKRLYLFSRDLISIRPWIYRYRVSDLFLSWFDEFKPDLIYTQLSNLESIGFISQLVQLRQTPLVIHIMDDWPSTLSVPGLLHYYWKSKINRAFKSLLNYSSIRMSICQAMSDEYLLRYNKDFVPFHNTIDMNVWEAVAKTDWSFADCFTILYAGRIGRGTSNSILSIANAIEELGDDGFKIVFELQTKSLPENFKEQINQLKFTRQAEFIPYEELPRKFSKADLLVLPMDFDEYNLKFIKYSMPTKVPEYLACGTPILVFASEQTALAKYAEDYSWAQVVLENNLLKLKEAIRILYNNSKRRMELGNIGKKVAKMNHDGLKVRNEFRLKMIEATD